MERVQQDDGGSHARGHAYLVTNRHVAVGHDRLLVRVNPVADTEAAQSFDLQLRREDGSEMWFAHPDPGVDVAVVPINAQVMRDGGMNIAYFHSDGGALRTADMKEKGVFEGDGAFILGFPMAMVGGNRNVAIVRTGAIARISDLLAGATNEYLVDAQVFPGNSGGPVIIKPEIVSIGDTKTLDASYLIGIVKSYVPYSDHAVSQQTGQVRVIFQENTGLAAAHPVDCIDEAIRAHLTHVPLVPDSAEEPDEVSAADLA